MKRRYSIRNLLMYWSLLALGVTAIILGYFLFQSRLDLFEESWKSKIQYDLESLRIVMQQQLLNDEWNQADQSLSNMATRPNLLYLALFDEKDMQVQLATRRAEIGHHFNHKLATRGLDSKLRVFQVSRYRDQFYALIPIQIPSNTTSRSSSNAWVYAHYDSHQDYNAMLLGLLQKISIVVAMMILYQIGQSHIVRQHVLEPLQRLVAFTKLLQEGRIGDTIKTHTSTEFIYLENAFNGLSLHLKHSMRQIEQQHMLNSAFALGFPDIAFVVDSDDIIRGRFGHNASSVERLNKDLIDTPFTAWVKLSEVAILEQSKQRAIDTRELVIHEFRHDDVFFESRMVPLIDQENNDISRGILWLIRDISDIKLKQELIEYQANFDPLTKLANRRLALEKIEQKIAQSQLDASWGAVLFIDLDHFKNINDSLGHPIGDQILIGISARLKSLTDPNDLVARLGGDEFLVLSGELFSTERLASEYAQTMAMAIISTIKEPFTIDVNNFHLSASIGIASFPHGSITASDLIRQSDTAMYQAKALGRSQVCIYNHSMQEKTKQRLHLFNDLHQAILDNAFSLVFQPQLDDKDHIIGAEVLCRWVNRGQSVSPDVFISAAEETSLILPLGRWLIMESCRTLKQWCDANVLPSSFSRLAINISAAQFMDPNFEEFIAGAVKYHKLPPTRLELELTETLFMEDKNIIREKMRALSLLGFTFALDDFGTGYSSLSYLQRLPINKLKIDQSFVMDIVDAKTTISIVDSIIQLGHNLKMDIIAEGVETNEQCAYLSNHGCHSFQGYLFSRPLTEENFLKFIRNHGSQQSA